jgi:predicted dinucleotide-binding enzyme
LNCIRFTSFKCSKYKQTFVIDATNHFVTFAPDFQLADLGGRASSEMVADYVPGEHLVKGSTPFILKY